MTQATTTQGPSSSSGFRQLVYASSVIGGGVVGYDYAHWLEINLIVGSILGSMISTGVTKFLYILKDDKEIHEGFIKTGAGMGAFAGAIVGATNFSGAEGFFGGIIVGAILGAIAGMIVGALVSLSALLLLTIGRGPIGIYLRSFTEKKPSDPDASVSIAQFDYGHLFNSFCDFVSHPYMDMYSFLSSQTALENCLVLLVSVVL